MNVQTRPPKLRDKNHPLPAEADSPLRSTFLHAGNLRRLGEDLARKGSCDLHGLVEFDFHRRNADNAENLFAVYRTLNSAQAAGEMVTPAGQWLLDNNYLVEETIYQVRRDLPRRFYRQLPVIQVRGGHIPRVLAIAWCYVAHNDSAVSPEMLRALVEGYQSVEPLRIGELWALPSLLRFVLVENLRRLAVRVDRSRQMRQIANDVGDRILLAGDGTPHEDFLDPYVEHARDTTFATQLLYRLRDGSQSSGRALLWLESELERYGSDAEETILAEHQKLSSGNVTTGNIVRGLRLINDTDWTAWFESVSQIDVLLRENSNFAALDFESRDQYRSVVEELARRSNASEYEVAEQAVRLTRATGTHDTRGDDAADKAEGTAKPSDMDIGFFLIGARRGELERAIGYRARFTRTLGRIFRKAGWLGVAIPVAILTALVLWMGAAGLNAAGVSGSVIAVLLGLFAVPAIEAATTLFNALVLLFLKPSRLVGFEYKDGVPGEARTLVAIPALIASRADVEECIRQLEVHYLANMKGAIYYAVLSDWPDSAFEQTADDVEILDYAREHIATLNRRYPLEGVPRFHLLHRRRLYNETQDSWMGWERKRGKLHELNLLLRGDHDTTFMPSASPLPDGVVYVMTLDSDTRMTRDAVARLAGKLSHPLNRPHFDSTGTHLVSGYGVLQPRVTPSLTTGDEASFFQRVFSAHRGLDPYVFTVSDVFQDVFGDGSFTGKGLYHVDAVEAALKGRILENTVLSHDLLEGAYARAALVTDVELVEDYPIRYAVDASRQHRWTRGDWQLLGLIFNPGSGVPGLSRWKMVDNLRRSLTPISWVLASVAGWTLLPFNVAMEWQLLLIVSLFVGPTFDIIGALLPQDPHVTTRGHFHTLGRDIAFGTAQVVLRIVLIAHTAWLMADAIARTLYRLFVSRRNLLEWRTASQVHQAGAHDLAAYYRMMWGALVIALVALAAPAAADSSGAWAALIFSGFWLASPAFAWLISRSAETEDRLVVSPDDTAKLRNIARRTWHYFETFVTSQHHFLPPDNFQETPIPVVAHRTSPTNIGVYLLSVISARDFGWISLANAAERLDQTLAAVERMETYRGHLYNWYDTQTLQPLHPLYVSSVDSGNLAGQLIAISAACSQWAQAPAAYLEGDLDGVLDAVGVLEDALTTLADDRRQLRPLRQRLRERIVGIRRAIATMKTEPETAAIRTINLAVLSGEIRKLAFALHHETDSAASKILANWAERLETTCGAHIDDAHIDEKTVELLRERLRELARRARLIAFRMDFSFLLRQDRKLLSIGYRVNEHELDESCYDLLASEARLASLFAIAKGDVPTDHWFRLGRPIVHVGFGGALMSWAGSMFEYLMPPLVMKEPQGGLLNQSSKLIIKKQIQYGRSKGIPWGISEAAYNARDREMTYQYTNFGVPGLGLKRGLAQNTVIAPYATALACQFKPREAVANFSRLDGIGALGRFGYHDAVDFTPQRLPEGSACAVVSNYMAHHQGMTIVAIANAIFEGRMRDRFHSDPVIEAAELLLQEKAPRQIPAAAVKTEAGERGKVEPVVEAAETRLIVQPGTQPRATSLMSNGHYSVMVTANGSGYSRLNEIAVTRWNCDPTEDGMGTYLFLRDIETGTWWSATVEPRQAPEETGYTLFADDKASFFKTVGTLRSEVECVVTSEGNGEARRITISNDGSEDRHIEVTSFAEIALAAEASDSAHPAFSKMFVKTEIAESGSAVFATRRKRSPGDPAIALVHFVTDDSGQSRETEAESDRRTFVGRGRTLGDAAAFDPGAKLSGSDGFVLDPAMALRRRIRVPANKKVAMTFWTVVGASRQDVEDDMARLDHSDSFSRQAMLAWTRSQVQARYVGLTLSETAGVQKLARYLIYPDPALRLPGTAIAEGLSQQSALWPTSISGDYPIFALRIGDVADLDIVAKALRMQEYLRARGLLVDFVVVNEQASSYVQDLQQAIESLCENSRLRGREHGPREHIFAVRRDLMDAHTYRTMLAAARVVLHTRNGTIFDQIERAEIAGSQAQLADDKASEPLEPASASRHTEPADRKPATALKDEPLDHWNGLGGFSAGGREYVIRLTGTASTPQPWINVVANGNFGFHSSAEGASFTWSRNSRDFQITPWSNDPVTNRPGEAIYIFDHTTGTTFSPCAAVARDASTVYEARHGQGLSTFRSIRGRLSAELTQLVDPSDPMKISRLVIRNGGNEPARLRVYAYAEWVLGTNRPKSAPFIVPAQDPRTGALLARNPYSLAYADRTAFLAGDAAPGSVTCDRTEFIGAGGTVALPSAVARGAQLSGTVEAGRDPCAAMEREIEVPPGGEATMLWLIGDAGSIEEARDLVLRHRARDFDERVEENDKTWHDFLGTLQVETPDSAFDVMVNRWLPYQSLACRIRARTAFYQASGAFGFRDQLQDTLALLLHDPQLARMQIVNAASRQFPEGDVQHWWLPRTGAGVRTRISDDVVWLAYAAARFVAVTGDQSIFDEAIYFIEGEPLQKEQHDAFLTPEISAEKASLYEHCARGLDLAIKRTGSNGLPLILGGDWNDGMDRVGAEGRGTSVWLGWFLLKALRDLVPVAQARRDRRRAERWAKHADALAMALDEAGWDGAWYRRGTFDDGSPFGSNLSDECQIDSIAQSWSVLSGHGNPARAGTAMASALNRLVDPDMQIVKLFWPPFDKTDKEPGYIKSYPPGVRENGGQYTHAAAWFVIALAEMGRADDAYRCFAMLNPINHALDREAAERYRVEPYVVAADIYSVGQLGGRGGWTWYTGSAGWLYRAAVESILGIRKEGGKLHIDPALPGHWNGFSAVLRIDKAVYRIRVVRQPDVRKRTVNIGGKPAREGYVQLGESGEFDLVVKIPGPRKSGSRAAAY
jgi:cyclic beta-1,2-glucan synthetase